MRRFVREALLEPVVRSRARDLAMGCGVGPSPQSQCCVYWSLRAWLRRVWRFQRDPAGVELVHRPERLLDEWQATGYISGDCDDAAVLGGALGLALGFAGRFVVLAFGGGPYQHVYTELLVDPLAGWLDLDITRSRVRPAPSRVKVVRI